VNVDSFNLRAVSRSERRDLSLQRLMKDACDIDKMELEARRIDDIPM
jgi:hypothetical protein